MFCDEPNPDGTRDFSMTRVIAFVMGVTYCAVMWKDADNIHLMGYPFMWLGVVVLLAVPLKMLFTYLQEWFSSSPGQKLLLTMMAKFSGATMDAKSGGVTVTTGVKTGDQQEGS